MTPMPRVRTMLTVLAAAALAAVAVASGIAHASEPPAGLVGRASVIDGDTLEIRGTRVRLWGLDAPESSQPCYTARGRSWRCGASAANALSDFIGSRTVICRQKGKDRYGRVIGQCFVGSMDANAWLVANGWALAYRRYSKAYVTHEDRARAIGAGIHASDFDAPWDYRAERR